jgi:hypothetical protein
VKRARFLALYSTGILLLLVAGCGGAALPTPYRSPLPTALPLSPLPTPTAPALRAWPTMTPTPLPVQAERARQFVVAQEGVPAEQLLLRDGSIALHPATGEELWIGTFNAHPSGRAYQVMVNAAGQASYPPDFSAQAIAAIAAETGIAADQLSVVSQYYITFPFTRKAIWLATIVDMKGGLIKKGIGIDLSGNPVDFAPLQTAEENARRAACPKLDAILCSFVLSAALEDMHDIQILLRQGADPGSVLALIESAGYAYRRDDFGMYYITLPKRLLLDLTALPAVASVMADYPAKTGPLDSNLLFGFQDAAGQVTLKVRTEKEYGCSNFTVDAELRLLEQSDTKRHEVVVWGIYRPRGCQTAMGPATWEVYLGPLGGRYELGFVYEDLRDDYILLVTPDRIMVEAVTQQFTRPEVSVWGRQP